jgi:hypothetical protein
MTEEEKVDAALHRLANPPRCHCGVSAMLTTPSQRGAFTAFYRCGLPGSVSDHGNHPLRSFIVCFPHTTLHLQYLFLAEGVPIL